MTAAIMIFLLLAGGLLQSLIPAASSLGLSKPPFLMAVALYYALVHSRGTAVIAAILAGIIQDSMSLLPVGYSSLCFVIFGAILVETRETLFRDSLFTVAILGAGLGALTTLGLYLMLTFNSLADFIPFWWVALKMGGTALLGLGAAPVVWWSASTLERHVGLTYADER
ncbi:MAG: rod shape-determining protein MreD [bacterium]